MSWLVRAKSARGYCCAKRATDTMEAMSSNDGVRHKTERLAASIGLGEHELAPDESLGVHAQPPEYAKPIAIPDRYADICLLGRGGFGEVRRVLDRKLDRVVAMKLLRADIDANLAANFELRGRFLAEIRLTAHLQHPGVVAVHDWGELDDGRLWFTMREVRGRTLREVIDEAFAASTDASVSPHIARRRLLEIFARVCETMAYVHSRGVIHRDLKPDNIMVGQFGEVMVMDWGIARQVECVLVPEPGEVPVQGEVDGDQAPLTARPEPSDFALSPVPSNLTRFGDIMGTPAYMAPEQATGDIMRHGPATDVHALGAILYHILVGRLPFTNQGQEWQQELLTGQPPLAEVAPPGFEVPSALAVVCERALAREPEARHRDAGELSVEVADWLAGAKRRDKALARLAQANAQMPVIEEHHTRASSLRMRARELLADALPFDPIECKEPGWNLEDEAEQLDREVALRETDWIQEVHSALAMDPELPEAHAALADHYRDKLLEAERNRCPADATRFEALLRAHDRGRHADVVAGMGTFTLVTRPEDARVTLYRYHLRRRRLVAEPLGDIGPTPIIELALQRGSYLLRIQAPGRAEVRYPVLIERGHHWRGYPPGASEPFPIALPLTDEIDENEVYVPAGWAWTGGDPDAADSLPRHRIWIDGFVIGRFPVTNAEYLAFLNDLAARGRESEALAACPRAERGMTPNADVHLSYERDEAGRFRLREHDPVEQWRPRTPAVLMNWKGAVAYSEWLAERTGLPYRLPNELEREKAVRGVDGRFYPWGDHFDATWACVMSSHRGEPGRVEVDAYPGDESPYGMRGGAGNSRDFCRNLWTLEGPPLRDGRLVIGPLSTDDHEYRSVRGGAWSSVENLCRAASRSVNRPEQRRFTTGLRIVRSYG
jgi:serine/threonine protein kinase/formylglycine-generating enzyme required for sulfatase activity